MGHRLVPLATPCPVCRAGIGDECERSTAPGMYGTAYLQRGGSGERSVHSARVLEAQIEQFGYDRSAFRDE